MFEPPPETKQSSSSGLWIGIAVLVVLLAGGFFFMQYKSTASGRMKGASAPLKEADAVRDLKIQRTAMDKDRNGTMSVWSVTIENKSAAYGYSHIQYETSYVGADGTVLMKNKGTFAEAIDPGEQKTFQANDALYPSGTARYIMKISGATASAQ